ncbi:hypothetical protein C8Q73DRAFT_710902 [Cubamyces lactineus]|nr:hypothetical protein C8Q73DRAFT_710902 [Cubamyces lactineus]
MPLHTSNGSSYLVTSISRNSGFYNSAIPLPYSCIPISRSISLQSALHVDLNLPLSLAKRPFGTSIGIADRQHIA